MGSVTAAVRREREEAVRDLVAFKCDATAASIQRMLAARVKDGKPAPIIMNIKTVRSMIKRAKEDNMKWLSDLAKTTYVADLRQRYGWLKDALLRTRQELSKPNVTPHARAQLNNSMVMLNAEITNLAENGGLYRYMQEWMNTPETESVQEEKQAEAPPQTV